MFLILNYIIIEHLWFATICDFIYKKLNIFKKIELYRLKSYNCSNKVPSFILLVKFKKKKTILNHQKCDDKRKYAFIKL